MLPLPHETNDSSVLGIRSVFLSWLLFLDGDFAAAGHELETTLKYEETIVNISVHVMLLLVVRGLNARRLATAARGFERRSPGGGAPRTAANYFPGLRRAGPHPPRIMWKLVRGLFGGKRRRRRKVEPAPDPDDRLDEMLMAVRARLERWLVSRRAAPGPVKKTSRWNLVKTNQGLYRLEAPGVSIMISTEPFLVRQKSKEGEVKVSGLLRMSELSLSGAVHEAGDLGAFLERAEPVTGSGRDLFQQLVSAGQEAGAARPSGADEGSPEGGREPVPEDLMYWEPFAVDQMIVQNSVNTLAHVLVHARPELENLLRGRLSAGLKRSLFTELESMLSAGGDRALNPHSQARSLLEFDEALADFRGKMKHYQALRRANLAREKRKQLP